jgi:N-acyl homoserine lactone hydrolase
MAAFDPFSDRPGEEIDVPYFLYVLVHPRGVVLFDSGPHPALASDPRAHLGAEADTWEILCGPADDVVGRLRTVGMRPQDVTHVVQSHLHYDHAGGLGALLHAPILVQREELEFAHRAPVYQQGIYVAADFAHEEARWIRLDGMHDVFGDGSVVLVPTPGHTAGHQSAVVRLPGWRVVLAGDAAYSETAMRTGALPAAALAWSPDAMVRSWRRLAGICEEQRAALITTHDLDGRSRALLGEKGVLR